MALPAFLDRIQLLDEPRLALFDADGVLWEKDVADDSTLWFIGTGRVRPTSAKWDEYKRIYKRDPCEGCRYLLTFFTGMPVAQLDRDMETYWSEFMKLDYLPEAIEVLRWFKERAFQIWVVTGSPTNSLTPLLKRLPVDRIIGMDYEVDARGLITGRHSGISCAGPGKGEKVASLWKGPIQFAVGNATLDEAMIRLARDVKWAFYPHPDLLRIAEREGWEILRSPKPPYGTTGWVSLEEELRERGFAMPEWAK